MNISTCYRRPHRRRSTLSRFFRIREDIPPGVYAAVAAISLLLALAIWAVLSYGQLVNPLFLPTPSDVLGAAGREIHDGTLWADMGASVYRIVLGGFDSKSAAENAASDLIKKGQIEEARVVPLGKSAKP